MLEKQWMNWRTLYRVVAFAAPFVFLFPEASSWGRVVYVSPSGNASDGSSWDQAFNTISDALLRSASGDEVWVKSGKYHETLDLRSGVGVYGGFAGSESEGDIALRKPEANITVIDATGYGRSAVFAHDVISATLDGVTVCNGYGPDSKYGGGLPHDIVKSLLVVKRCRITENVADAVGGMQIRDSTVSILDCAICGNSSPYGSFRLAGGVVVWYSAVYMGGCVVMDHYEVATEGAIVTINSGTPYEVEIDNCTVTNNVGYNTGGILCLGNTTVSGCYIANNTQENLLGGGGGVSIGNGELYADCTIVKNHARYGGGVSIRMSAKRCKVISSEISYNYATEQGGGIDDGGTIYVVSLLQHCGKRL